MSKYLKKIISILIIVSIICNIFACNKINTVKEKSSLTTEEKISNESDSEKVKEEIENDSIIESKTEKNINESLESESETSSIEKIEEEKEHVEGKYPIHWDLKQIYNDLDEWEKDYKKFENFIATISELQGTINSVDGIYKYIMLNEEGEIPIIYNKLYAYVSFNKDLNTVDSTYLNLQSRLNLLFTEYGKATSFFDEEIKKIPIDDLKKYFEDEKLKPYKHYYNNLFFEDRPKYSKETLDAIIQATSNYGGEENTFNALQYADLKKPKITMPNGEVKELDDKLFDEITYGDYSREFKKEADNLHLSETKDYINTLTSMLYNHMKEVYNQVKLDNGNEVLKHELENTSVDRSIYDNIIESTHNLLPQMQRFLKIKKELLNVDEMYFIDVLGTYSKYDASSTYDDAVDKVREALRILGDEYISKFDEMVTNGHIDVYPHKNKVTGGYESNLSNKNIKPFVLLNFTGFVNEVKTIAHELGHAIFSFFTEENVKNTPNMNISIFLHEIASTFNENIFTRYMIDNAKDDKEKMYFVEDRINDINAALIRQILYSEFEDFLYKKIEKGENFEANELCDKWMELHKTYYGDAVNIQDGMKYRWAAIPHFYYVYYVYKYATSLTYSSILAKDVYEKKEGAVEKYIEFLKHGEDEEPANILTKMGIDPRDKNIYTDFLEYYTNLVDEFEELAKGKGRRK